MGKANSEVRAVVYCRISHDEAGAGLGIGRQRKDYEELAARLGWTVVAVFEDNSVSAYSGKPRPEYTRMIEYVQHGHADAIVAYHLDRLHRSQRELADFVTLCRDRDIAVQTVRAGVVDLSTASGRLNASILGAVAVAESERLGERVSRKRQQNAEAGLAGHGPVAYGWRREAAFDEEGRKIGSRDVLDAEAAGVLREAARRLLAGESLRRITADFQARGVPTARGKTWHAQTLRHMLLRERNVGRAVYRGEVIGAASWEPLFDEGTWLRVRAVLMAPERRTAPNSTARKYWLSGLAWCGVCGEPTWAAWSQHTTGVKTKMYRCKRGCVRRDLAAVDALTETRVIEWLASEEAAGLLAASRDDAANQAVGRAEELRARLEAAADVYAEGLITREQLTRISGRLRPQLAQAEAAAARTRLDPVIAGAIGPQAAEHWAGLTLEQKRLIAKEIFTVTIHKATRRGPRRPGDPLDVTVEPRKLDP